jgi:hypothetical protein
MAYADDLKRHLERYKVDVLRVEGNGLYRRAQYAHILPDDDQFLNILDPFREDFRSCVESGRFTIDLGRLTHLNSSLAMGINLFFPFICCGWYTPLLSAVEIDSEEIQEATFETVMPDQTHVDVLLKGHSERRLFFEIKLKEDRFGPANNASTDYNRIFNDRKGLLASRLEDAYLTVENFRAHYQLFRYLTFISPDNSDMFCIVVPRRNEQFSRSISFLWQALRATMRQRVRIAYLEDVIERLIASTKHDERFHKHFDLFKKKYILF